MDCQNCVYYVYDEEIEDFECTAPIDEDELYRFMNSKNSTCIYFRLYDEYGTARKQ